MLRLATAQSSGCLGRGLRRQWQPQRIRIPRQPFKRAFADEQRTSVAGVPTGPIQAGGTTAASNPGQTTSGAPITSPAKTEPIVSNLPPTGTGTASTGPAATPPPKKPRRRFRNFLLSLIILSTLGYAGSVYYALLNDNFHDFFTEYIPGGEDAVAYFEEREFRKRFPSHEYHQQTWPQRRGEQKVTIGKASGIRPKVSSLEDGGGEGARGRHVSAVEDNRSPGKAKMDAEPEGEKGGRKSGGDDDKEKGAVQKVKDAAVQGTKKVAEVAPKGKEEAKNAASSVKEEAKQTGKTSTNAASTQSKPAPTTPPGTAAQQIDHLNVPNASEPVVQEIVKLLNNIITTVNESHEAGKYSTALTTAKEEVNNIIHDVGTLQNKAAADADSKVQKAHAEFEEAAKELVGRVDREMQEQEVKWRDEYESERERLSDSYQQKLSHELAAADKVAHQKEQNALLQQEIQLQKNFMTQVHSSIETERAGRLSKLDELSSTVSELENLTAQWNEIVDSTLRTQHLQVALEALRARLAAADHHTTKPFLNELVALKDLSAEDEIVNVAIASIPPVAYQRGVPSPAALIDRFRRVASEVRKASLLPQDAGVASHAASAVLSRLLFTKKSSASQLADGEDVEAILGRSEVLLEQGELDSAVREMNALTGWAGVLSRDWIGECRRVLEVRMAVEVIATEARLQSLLVD